MKFILFFKLITLLKFTQGPCGCFDFPLANSQLEERENVGFEIFKCQTQSPRCQLQYHLKFLTTT